MSGWVVWTVLAGAAAVVDWWAVAGERRVVEHVGKPPTMALLIAVAATAGGIDGAGRVLLVIGAVLGLVGDVALMDDREFSFMVGLGAFALGHAAYSASALTIGFDPAWCLPGVAFMVALLS